MIIKEQSHKFIINKDIIHFEYEKIKQAKT